MQYPLISEYIEAIRSAEDNFDKLNNLRPVLDNNGNPIMSSGNFAVVFKMKDIDSGKFYAVKCFTREQEERAERYREIIKVLDEIKSPYFVPTHYFDKELFVDTTQNDETEFPVLVMDWVEGEPLDLYLKSIRDSKFKRALLSKQFQKLVCWLLPKHFAHGDIKPDNIIVKEDGSIVLVDYDGMFVPALRGKEALEMGTPLYRHATRTLSFFNEYIDDFASVLLLLLLKVNELTDVELDKYLTDNTSEFLGFFDEFINYPSIAPLLSAYIMVSTFGRIDRQQISCLLSNNSDFDFNKESALLDLARQGDTIAMKELGRLYYEGIYVPQSASKAMQWYTLAKLLGNVDVTCGLCRSISENNDFIINNEILLNCLKKYRVNFAYCREGEKLYSNEKYEQAISWILKAADMGASSAQRNLGICYANGYGVDKDLHQAVSWYKKAAEAGNSKAQYNLARCYYEGNGVEKDIVKAVYWWRKAVEAGNSSAQFALAFCYYNGNGVEKDTAKAIYWWKKSAEAGDSDAQYNLARCYYEGNGVGKDMAKAIYWLEKSAEAEDSKAQYNLAFSYYDGNGVEKDLAKAIYWWKKAANNKNFSAMRALAICYYNGIGVEHSIQKSNYWLRELSVIKDTKVLTASQILKQFQFIETFTIEQFRKTHNNNELRLRIDDEGSIVLKCGKETVSLVDNTIPKRPMISRICHSSNGNTSNNSIWIIHEEGVENRTE